MQSVATQDAVQTVEYAHVVQSAATQDGSVHVVQSSNEQLLNFGKTFPFIFDRVTKRLSSIAGTYPGDQNLLYQQYLFLHTYISAVQKASLRAASDIAEHLSKDVRNNTDLQGALGIHRKYTFNSNHFQEFVIYHTTYNNFDTLYNNYKRACEQLKFVPREKLEHHHVAGDMPKLEDKFHLEIVTAFDSYWGMLKENIGAPLSFVQGETAHGLLEHILEHCCVRLTGLKKEDLPNHLLVWNYYVTYM